MVYKYYRNEGSAMFVGIVIIFESERKKIKPSKRSHVASGPTFNIFNVAECRSDRTTFRNLHQRAMLLNGAGE